MPPSTPSIAPPTEAPAAPAAQTPPSSVSIDAEISSELDSLDLDAPKPPEQKPDPAKPPAQPTKKPDEKKAEAQPDKKEETPKPVKAAELRTAYEGLKKRVKDELEPELTTLRTRIKEIESKKPEDNKPLIDELESTKKRRDELEEEIKYLNYQKSSEYQEKYVKPYQEAWQRALADLEELTVETAEGGSRTANAQDLLKLANLPLGEARKLARELFGDAADDVMAHRRTIRELSLAQNKALEDAQKNSAEREKELTARRQIEHQKALDLWREANETLAKKYPNWFAPADGDTEGNKLLTTGFALADLHFIGAKDLTAEQIDALPQRFRDAIRAKGNLDVQDRVSLDALLRNKIASHSRIAFRLKKATDRIKELEKSLAEYEESAPKGKPGQSGSKGTGTGNYMAEVEAELDSLDTAQ